MGDETNIAWTDMTWNPVRGCYPVSPGCGNCYAEKVAFRFCGPGQPYEGTIDHRGRWNNVVRLVPEKLLEPMRKQRPRRIFVNSMSDWAHESIPFSFWCAMMAVMGGTPWHVFQPLTKRPDHLRKLFGRLDEEVVNMLPDRQPIGDESVKMDARRAVYLAGCARSYGIGVEAHFELKERLREQPWPLRNLHVGVSAEDDLRWTERVGSLLQLPAALRWVSVEPQIGPIDPCTLDAWLGDLDWIVLGGESGPKARPFNVEWAYRWIRDCDNLGVPLFIKQLGSEVIQSIPPHGVFRPHNIPGMIHDKKGADPSEWPAELRVQQFPTELEGA